jgi:hypothetical protein
MFDRSYYQRRRQAAEDCLSDILAILCDGRSDCERVDEILTRLTTHFASEAEAIREAA